MLTSTNGDTHTFHPLRAATTVNNISSSNSIHPLASFESAKSADAVSGWLNNVLFACIYLSICTTRQQTDPLNLNTYFQGKNELFPGAGSVRPLRSVSFFAILLRYSISTQLKRELDHGDDSCASFALVFIVFLLYSAFVFREKAKHIVTAITTACTEPKPETMALIQ